MSRKGNKAPKNILKSLAILLVGVFFFSISYIPVNFFNSTLSHHYRLYFDFELVLPIWDWMIIPYVSAYLLPILPLFRLSLRRLKALAFSISLAGLIGGVIFLILPTQLGFIRDQGISDFWKPTYQFLYMIDPPHNLFPSMHVVMAYMLIVPCLNTFKNVLVKAILVSWLLLICASIIFTHQHHLLDLIGGIELSWFMHRFVYAYSLSYLRDKSKSFKVKEFIVGTVIEKDDDAA